jgi:2-(1,2-epoxy-1,2-dihydrophenyl)acetyl-CoA isomerase
MSKKFEEILFQVKDHVAKITFNRPRKMNAMTPKMEEELKSAFRICQDDNDIRVLILTGAGRRGFSTGMDVGKLVDLEGTGPVIEPGQTIPTPSPSSGVARAMLSIVEKPVIAAVNGACAGAGYCMALASDIRIASENARFVHVYLRRALIASGETWLLAKIIGLGAAMYHILTADEISAEEALRLNLVSKLVPAEKLDDEAFALAAKLAAFDPTTVKFTKKAVRKSVMEDFEGVMEWVAYARRAANPSGAGLAAMKGFLEKK